MSLVILTKKPEEISFEETIKILSGTFDKRDSLFHTRYKCLNNVKQENDVCVCVWVSFKKGLFLKDKFCFECGYVGHKSSHSRYKQKRKKQKFKTKVNDPRVKLKMVKKGNT